MNKKSKLIVAGTLVVVLIIGGGIALSSNGGSLASAAALMMEDSAVAPTTTVKPADEADQVKVDEDKVGKIGKGGKGGKDGRRDKGCEAGQGVGGVKDGNPSAPTVNPSAAASSIPPAEQAANTVVISGGLETDPVDHGRPVVLIAAALGVPTEVFREAFSGVTPAGSDGGPSSELAQKNKAALMKVLEPYGITNDRLDEVSNYYRYSASKGESWKIIPATATVTVTNGVVTGVKITNAGAGYSSNPTITIKGPDGKVVNATATVIYTEDFKMNGSITAITLNK